MFNLGNKYYKKLNNCIFFFEYLKIVGIIITLKTNISSLFTEFENMY